MRSIDRLYTECPLLGARKIRKHFEINRKQASESGRWGSWDSRQPAPNDQPAVRPRATRFTPIYCGVCRSSGPIRCGPATSRISRCSTDSSTSRQSCISSAGTSCRGNSRTHSPAEGLHLPLPTSPPECHVPSWICLSSNRSGWQQFIAPRACESDFGHGLLSVSTRGSDAEHPINSKTTTSRLLRCETSLQSGSSGPLQVVSVDRKLLRRSLNRISLLGDIRI